MEYAATRERITDPLIIRECDSHEFHWRLQMHLKLRQINSYTIYYETDDGPIDEKAAVVVNAFASWPKDRIDPLLIFDDGEDALRKLGASFSGDHHLIRYLTRSISKRHKERIG